MTAPKSNTSDYCPLAVVGTVAIDSVETPFGKRNKVFGGSATYFSYVASLFTRVALVAVVGKDFPKEYFETLKGRSIDLSHLEVLRGKTFHWKGRYEEDLNTAHTLETQLNVLLDFRPKLSFKKTPEFIFLANIDPHLQQHVLDQLQPNALRYVACDTMNYWIHHQKTELLKVLKRVDCVVVNDGEARLLTGEVNVMKAAKKISLLGPKHVIVKKGEHGVVLLYEKEFCILPAYPVEDIYDPTGAGDSFAGGVMGYLALTRDISLTNLKKALGVGTIAASFTVQGFGLEGLEKITRRDIENRMRDFQKICRF